MNNLPNLSEKEIQAELGYTYHELKKEYPNWAADLHMYGHILNKDQLELIFKKGIMLWYIRYHVNNIINKNSILPHNDITQIIYDSLEKQNIIKIGIVFQRWKVILEKMMVQLFGKPDDYMHNVYSLSKFLDIVQSIIYHHIKHYVNAFNDALAKNNINLFDDILDTPPDFYENELYFNILFCCMNNDSFLNKKYENPELIDFNIMKLI